MNLNSGFGAQLTSAEYAPAPRLTIRHPRSVGVVCCALLTGIVLGASAHAQDDLNRELLRQSRAQQSVGRSVQTTASELQELLNDLEANGLIKEGMSDKIRSAEQVLKTLSNEDVPNATTLLREAATAGEGQSEKLQEAQTTVDHILKQLEVTVEDVGNEQRRVAYEQILSKLSNDTSVMSEQTQKWGEDQFLSPQQSELSKAAAQQQLADVSRQLQALQNMLNNDLQNTQQTPLGQDLQKVMDALKTEVAKQKSPAAEPNDSGHKSPAEKQDQTPNKRNENAGQQPDSKTANGSQDPGKKPTQDNEKRDEGTPPQDRPAATDPAASGTKKPENEQQAAPKKTSKSDQGEPGNENAEDEATPKDASSAGSMDAGTPQREDGQDMPSKAPSKNGKGEPSVQKDEGNTSPEDASPSGSQPEADKTPADEKTESSNNEPGNSGKGNESLAENVSEIASALEADDAGRALNAQAELKERLAAALAALKSQGSSTDQPMANALAGDSENSAAGGPGSEEKIVDLGAEEPTAFGGQEAASDLSDAALDALLNGDMMGGENQMASGAKPNDRASQGSSKQDQSGSGQAKQPGQNQIAQSPFGPPAFGPPGAGPGAPGATGPGTGQNAAFDRPHGSQTEKTQASGGGPVDGQFQQEEQTKRTLADIAKQAIEQDYQNRLPAEYRTLTAEYFELLGSLEE